MSVYLQPNPSVTNRNEMPLLTKEMFKWLVGCREDKEKKLNRVYIRVLKALMEIKEFDTEFCLYVNEKEQTLGYSRRTRGSIYLNRMCIVKFSHDSEYENRSFDSLCEWPEAYNKKVVKKWTIVQWRNFFIDQIKQEKDRRLQDIRDGMKELEEKLSDQQKENNTVSIALGKNNVY